jgi:hypothetical protein
MYTHTLLIVSLPRLAAHQSHCRWRARPTTKRRNRTTQTELRMREDSGGAAPCPGRYKQGLDGEVCVAVL